MIDLLGAFVAEHHNRKGYYGPAPSVDVVPVGDIPCRKPGADTREQTAEACWNR